MQRFSKQREAIVGNLRSRTDHPTADMVYESLRGEYPNLSLGTVYRNLAQLSEAGVVLKLTCGESEHYDGNSAPHIHFICDCCNSITDIFEPYADGLIESVERETGGKVDNGNFVLHGRCKTCLQQ